MTLTAPHPTDVSPTTYTSTQTAYVYKSGAVPGNNSGTNLGAIIGGAVDGFAALSATAFGLFFVRWKLKKDKNRKAASASLPPVNDTTASQKAHLLVE